MLWGKSSSSLILVPHLMNDMVRKMLKSDLHLSLSPLPPTKKKLKEKKKETQKETINLNEWTVKLSQPCIKFTFLVKCRWGDFGKTGVGGRVALKKF